MAERSEAKKNIREELDKDKFLGNYAPKTRDRIAGTVAKMLQEKEPKVDFGKEITGPQGTSTGGIFGQETVDGIMRQKTAVDISIARLKKMRVDAQVQLGLTAIKAPIIGALADVPAIEGNDPNVNAFVDTMLEGFWKSLVRSSMNGLDFGFLPHEKIFSKEDFTWMWEEGTGDKKVTKEQSLPQAWVLKKLKDIDPDGVKIWVEKETGSFAGFTEKGKEAVHIVPAPKAFVFTPEREFGNLYGKPRLVPAYEPWTTFVILEYFSNRYFERFGEPGLKVGHSTDPVQNENGTRETYPGELAAAAAEAYKGNGIYLHPNVYDEATKQPIYTFDVITDDRRGGDWIGILDFHLKRILRGLLIPERALTQDTQVGSLASAEAYHAHFILMLQQTLESFIEHVNLYIIPEIILLNIGADAEPAKLVAPMIGSENQLLIDKLIEQVMKDDVSVRGIVDWTNMLIQNNIPIIEKGDEGEEPEKGEPVVPPEEESKRTRTIAPNTEMITVNSPETDTQALATAAGLDNAAKGLMAETEAAIDKQSKPVWDKVLGYEKAMRNEAKKFLANAKLKDGRMDKRKNERALRATISKINKIKDDMLKYYKANDASRTDAYFDGFEELGLKHAKRLAALYGVPLPKGYAKAVREEKLGRGFGGASRSFLENILLAGERAAPALAGLLMLAEDQGQVVDEDEANSAMVIGASTAFIDDADNRGWATDTVDKASDAFTAGGAGVIFDKAASTAKTAKDKAAAKAQAKKVGSLRFVAPKDTVGAVVDDWHMNRGYLTQTIEAPARGTYRWTLSAVAALAGWDVAKMYQNPKTIAEGTPSGLTEKYKGKIATLNRWDEIARVEKVKEPLKLYGFNRGTRSYWFYMPLLWAEKQELDIDKAGGE